MTIDIPHHSLPQRPLVSRDEWIELPDSYLYTGAQSPALASVRDAVAEAIGIQSRAGAGRAALIEGEERARETVAGVWGCLSEDVAFVGDASTAWNLVANGLRWRPGDNVVVNDLEHASVYLPFLRLASQGLDVRFVAAGERGLIEAADVLAAVDERTRAVVISHVAYTNGARHDVATLSAELAGTDAALFVDWSHSLGVLPIDVTGVALGVSASYKWSLGPYGVGLLHWNRDLLPDFVPGGVGWRSVADLFAEDRFARVGLDATANRFRQGAASFSGIAGVDAGLRRLTSLGIDRVADHALDLAAAAHDQLTSLGFTVLSPRERAHASGNVSIAAADGEQWARELSDLGVEVWGGDGRVRASFHVMNDRDDVGALVAGLADRRAP